jgi:PhzF family phenazine biosynthesis protein
MSTKAPFALLTAFSGNVNGGNPAVVVFLDIHLPRETLSAIARNLNQPMACFVSSSPLPSKDEKTVAFGIRWFTSADVETPICGHGTIAAAKAVFERSDLVTDAVEVIEFHTLTHGTMTARKVEGNLIEIRLPSARQSEVTGEERAAIHQKIVQMFGKENLAINYIGKGVDNFDHCKCLYCLRPIKSLRTIRSTGRIR